MWPFLSYGQCPVPSCPDKGSLSVCPSRDDPGIVRVSRESQDTQTREVELCPSRDDPGIVRVSQESQDTQTREVELCPPRDDPGIASVPGIPGYSDNGGRAMSIPG